MPVVYLTETQAREAGVTQVFKTAIIKQNTDQKSLAKKIGMKYSTLHKRIPHARRQQHWENCGKSWMVWGFLKKKD